MKINFIIVLLLICIVISCRNKDNVEGEVANAFLKEKIGNQIHYPNDVKVFYPENVLYDSTSTFNFPVNIVTYIDFGCGNCYNQLLELEFFLTNFKKHQVGLIVFGYTDTGYSGYYTFISYYPNFSFPIFADINKEYIKANNIPINDMNLSTFLIDHKKVIHLIGNPLTNRKVNNLYISKIEKLVSNL